MGLPTSPAIASYLRKHTSQIPVALFLNLIMYQHFVYVHLTDSPHSFLLSISSLARNLLYLHPHFAFSRSPPPHSFHLHVVPRLSRAGCVWWDASFSSAVGAYFPNHDAMSGRSMDGYKWHALRHLRTSYIQCGWDRSAPKVCLASDEVFKVIKLASLITVEPFKIARFVTIDILEVAGFINAGLLEIAGLQGAAANHELLKKLASMVLLAWAAKVVSKLPDGPAALDELFEFTRCDRFVSIFALFGVLSFLGLLRL
ncbi:hypothetical protein FA13DRAFT_1767045 [Coprinellus micaceus]|uniref:Uncharacterized protein n=1 Tax=Coprinellus micaceus TaxID=71717 RepID=A0A4Y7SE17_COPMI|nr:hypothetical protein FA13DRAFT_1767045 [Coprinellus micaceus]